MRIREAHAIRDRIKVMLILMALMIAIGMLAHTVRQKEESYKTASIETLLKTALQPVGSTMYIWGGGWDDADNGSGTSSTRLGLSPVWETFSKEQDETYDFENHRFEREKGLDCSGFVGWVLYNTFETREGKTGYVTSSTDMAESLAAKGWGKLIQNPQNFLPGDIVSMEGHVWISLGTCEDGSVLLVHSSPPGVSVCGTPSTLQFQTTEESAGGQSMAVTIATEYMGKYHPQWQEKYPNRQVNLSYLENVTLFRWSREIMSDAKKIQEKSAEEMIRILSPDM